MAGFDESKRDKLQHSLNLAIRRTLVAHGPVSKENTGSVTKRAIEELASILDEEDFQQTKLEEARAKCERLKREKHDVCNEKEMYKNKYNKLLRDMETEESIVRYGTIRVHRNLHRGCYSIVQHGRVVGHEDTFCLLNAEFRVGEKSRQRVVREKRKNVHAYVKGTETNVPLPSGLRKVTYNPYDERGAFILLDTDEPIWFAEYVYGSNSGLYVKVVEHD